MTRYINSGKTQASTSIRIKDPLKPLSKEHQHVYHHHREYQGSDLKNCPRSSPVQLHNLKPYEHSLETKEDLPWAEFVTLDLEDYDRPGGKERLAKQLEHC
jgi:hypothetical protein